MHNTTSIVFTEQKTKTETNKWKTKQTKNKKDLSMTGSEHCGCQAAFNFSGKGKAGGKFSNLCGCPYKK